MQVNKTNKHLFYMPRGWDEISWLTGWWALMSRPHQFSWLASKGSSSLMIGRILSLITAPLLKVLLIKSYSMISSLLEACSTMPAAELQPFYRLFYWLIFCFCLQSLSAISFCWYLNVSFCACTLFLISCIVYSMASISSYYCHCFSRRS